MDLSTKLTHRITITPVDNISDYGEPSIASTAVASIACFIDGTHRRVLRSSGREIVANFSIYFKPDTDIGIDYMVSGGVTALGDTILTSGKVVSVEKSFHPQLGLIVIEALVEAN